MKQYFRYVRSESGWRENVELELDGQLVRSIQPSPGNPGTAPLIAIPGIANVHSHAFQFAFAGLSEYRSSAQDSFWSWRQLMYDFVETLTPESLFQIGLEVYQAMRRAGYTTVGEFHYLHHQPGGKPYQNVNEMADALVEAALQSGLNLCLLPVLYQRGGFDGAPLKKGQLRFGTSNEMYLKMLEKLSSDHGCKPNVRIGVALHSLRAVSIESAQATLAAAESILPGCPIHIHIAEQTQEVDDCSRATGRRPVQLLFDSFPVDERWCLIHATHMISEEVEQVARSGAVVGVCPTTEANLGDGFFPVEEFLRLGGRLAIGSDSHVSLDPRDELRTLEYGQRLLKRRRALLCSATESCGELLTRWVSEGGAQATGFGSGQIAPGNLNGITTLPVTSETPARSVDRWVFTNHPLR